MSVRISLLRDSDVRTPPPGRNFGSQAEEGMGPRALSARAASSADARMSGAKESMVLIPLPGVGTLELTRAAYEAALRPIAAAPATAGATPSDQPAGQLVNAKALAAQLSLPVSCVYEYARSEKIPCVRAGKHVRFSPAAVLAALSALGEATGGRA